MRRLDQTSAADLPAALARIAAAGGDEVHWLVSAPTEADDALALEHGLLATREVFQLRRPLPVDEPVPPIRLRPFVAGVDDDDWLAVNNRAFSWHPDQGGWTHADLARKVVEPWFDAEGFLLHHDDDGHLAGFVWTKVHAEDSPPLGEIFVIAVDPDHGGRGLGRALTLAGLDWLHRERGTPVGMLYVDKTNVAARVLYDQLGFTLHHIDRWYAGMVGPIKR